VLEAAGPGWNHELSLALGRGLFDFDGDNGLVVKRFHFRCKFRNGLEQGSDDALGGFVGTGFHDFFDATASEHVTVPVAGVENSIAQENEHVSWLSVERVLLIVGIVEKSEWQAAGFNGFDFSIMAVKRPRESRVCDVQGPALVVPDAARLANY
jgi:hypothetical protein